MSPPSLRIRIPAVLLLLALPYAPFLAGWEPLPGVAGGLLLALAGLGAPGAAGLLLSRAVSFPGRVAAALFAAALLNLGAAVGWRVFGAEPTPAGLALALGLPTVVAGAIGAARGGTAGRWHPAAAAIAVGAFLLFAWAGSGVVPALEDQDGEVQGTANGIVRELSPLSLTNRSRLHFFAHPPLSHLFAAVTITLAGDLETVRPPYDAAREERAAAAVDAGEAARGPAAILRAFRDPPPLPDRGFLWASRVFNAFQRDPALAGTRAPNYLFGALTAWLVFAWSRRLGAETVDSALAAAAYATLPEIVVRSAYGGYYAATAATLTTAVWLAQERTEPARRAFGAGVLAALVNHKAILLGAAATLPIRRGGSRGDGPRPAWLRLPALWLGLGAGAALFWAWGLYLAPADFVGEHLLDHGLRRFSGGEVLSRSGVPVYPSRLGLWGEFAAHFGPWVIVAAAGWIAAAGAFFARSGEAADAHADAALEAEAGARRALALWVLAGALLFTLTDWRQTKHLCLLVPALAVLGAVFPAHGRLALARRAVWATAIVWNVVWIGRLARDFGAMTVTPLW